MKTIVRIGNSWVDLSSIVRVSRIKTASSDTVYVLFAGAMKDTIPFFGDEAETFIQHWEKYCQDNTNYYE